MRAGSRYFYSPRSSFAWTSAASHHRAVLVPGSRFVFALLLPVKEFARSKQRLAGWLTPEERVLLARAMFEDVWQTLRSECRQYPLFVISAEPIVIERCRAEGVRCFLETAARSHSESVTEATRRVRAFGVRSLLSLPIDTPAVRGEEIAALEEMGRQIDVIIVPSADGIGTNALLRTPPDAIAPRFGPGSCAIHAEQARARKLSYLVQPVESLAADIDTRAEAVHFLSLAESLGRAGRTAALLRQFLDARREAPQRAAVCS
jgi:2-phospho-L-lactate/phosphoenolpyruvate guanylyltransferase